MSRRPAEECLRTVTAMIASMRHRPDYVEGVHAAPEIGLYAAWSAHPGSFAERVSSQGGQSVRIAFSGECWRDGDSGLDDASTDARATAWLGEAYRAQGVSFLERCSGTFSGVLIDDATRSAWIFNDRFPVERLYVHEAGEQLLFASEAKAILAVAADTRHFDDRGVADFLAFGSVLQGRTLFRGIALLPGATVLQVDASARRSSRRYFVPDVWEAAMPLPEADLLQRLKSTLPLALGRYMNAPTRLGISLTGGLDSRMILACGLPRAAKAVCYTFDNFTGQMLDTRISGRLAGMRGLAHHILRLDGTFLTDFREHMDRTVFVSDGCAGLLAAHEIPLNARARELAGIRVTGNFGSEIMRTMSTFKPVQIADGFLNDAARRLVAQSIAAANERPVHPVTHAAFREVPWHLFGILAAARSQLVVRTPFLDNALVFLAYHASVHTRIGVDSTLAAIAECDPALATVPTDRGVATGGSRAAQLLRRAFCAVTFKLDYLDKEGLTGGPAIVDAAFQMLDRIGLLGLHKFLPYRRWLRTELAPYADSALADIASRRMPYWSPGPLRNLSREHAAGVQNRVREIHLALTLDAVDRTLLHTRA